MFFFCSDHLVFAKLPRGLHSYPGPSGLCCCPSPEDRGRGWAELGDLGWTSSDHPHPKGALMTFQTRGQPESPQRPQGTSKHDTGAVLFKCLLSRCREGLSSGGVLHLEGGAGVGTTGQSSMLALPPASCETEKWASDEILGACFFICK